jgi:hypothetical protein
MRKTILIFLLLSAINTQAKAQKKLFTQSGVISFYSKTSIEKIEAINKKVLAVLDLENNKIEFAVLIKGFEFEKALMQEHFNEDYLESDKYPKAVFKGSFDEKNLHISTSDNKMQTLVVTGNLTMHGATKSIKTTAVITVKNHVITASSVFTIILSDYNIKVPALAANNINKNILVNINIPSLQEMK